MKEEGESSNDAAQRLLRDASLPASAAFLCISAVLALTSAYSGGGGCSNLIATAASLPLNPLTVQAILLLSAVSAMNNVLCFDVAKRKTGVLDQKVCYLSSPAASESRGRLRSSGASTKCCSWSWLC